MRRRVCTKSSHRIELLQRRPKAQDLYPLCMNIYDICRERKLCILDNEKYWFLLVQNILWDFPVIFSVHNAYDARIGSIGAQHSLWPIRQNKHNSLYQTFIKIYRLVVILIPSPISTACKTFTICKPLSIWHNCLNQRTSNKTDMR